MRRWVLIVSCVAAACGPAPAGASAADGNVERFWAEASPQWQAAEAAARTLQGRVTKELHVTIPDRKIDDTETIRYTVRQTPGSALLSGSLILAKRNDPTQYVFLANPRYAAVLRRDSEADASFLLRTFAEDPNTVFQGAPATVQDWALSSLCPHYCYSDVPLSRLRLQPGFEARKAEFGTGGGASVRVTVRYVKNPNTPQVWVTDAVLTFAPGRQWHLTGVEETVDQSVGKHVTQVNTQYLIDEASPAPLPLIREQRVETRSRSGAVTSRVIRYELDRRVPADAEFTLSAFDLPEPAGADGPRPTPVYVWLLAAAGVAGVLAVAFGWLRRRATKPRPAAGPAP